MGDGPNKIPKFSFGTRNIKGWLQRKKYGRWSEQDPKFFQVFIRDKGGRMEGVKMAMSQMQHIKFCSPNLVASAV